MNIDFGDGGCHGLVDHRGGVADPGRYWRLDCPFPGDSTELRARRQLLWWFHRKMPASYADIMHSCNPLAGVDDVADKTPFFKLRTYWRFKSEHPLQDVLAEKKELGGESAQDDFIRGTLRLLPVMWARLGFLDVGLTSEALRPKSDYPMTRLGEVKSSGLQLDFPCAVYKSFTREETLRTRRVLRALLPTWGVHTFTKDHIAESVRYVLDASSLRSGNPFDEQLVWNCEAGSRRLNRDDAVYASTPLRQLQNAAVLQRDVGSCYKRYPCAYLDRTCEETGECSCKCYRSICRVFVSDFVAAMHRADYFRHCMKWSHDRLE